MLPLDKLSQEELPPGSLYFLPAVCRDEPREVEMGKGGQVVAGIATTLDFC